MKRFRTQLMLVSILLMIFSVLGTAEVVSIQFTDALWEQDSAAMSKQFELAEEQVVDLLYKANHSLAVIQKRDSVLDFFIRSRNRMPGSAYFPTVMLNDITITLNQLKTISGVLFIQDNLMYGITPSWNFNGTTLPDGLVQVVSSARAAYGMDWCGVYSLQDFVNVPIGDASLRAKSYLTGVSHMRYPISGGMIDVDVITLISIEDINSILDQIGNVQGEVTLVDGSGTVLAGQDIALPDISAKTGTGNMDFDYGGSSYRVFFSRSFARNWHLTCRIDGSIYQSQAARLKMKSFMTGAAAIFCMALVYLMFTHAFFRPFQQVIGLFKQVQSGNLAARLPPFSRHIIPVSDEVTMMREQLNNMLDSIETLIANNERANRERTEMEMHALQSQLNPHMIFNTITSIRWMIMLQQENWPGSERVNAMLVEFAALLQPVFDAWKPEWTLAEELDYISHYVTLLRMRYCADFSLDEDITPAMRSAMIPRFILQPVLENSCEHGMAGSQSVHIDLSVRTERDDMIITICDDGCGMPPELLERLHKRLESATYEEKNPSIGHGSIGLININRQLRTQFGGSSGLSVESDEGAGTCVTLRIRFGEGYFTAGAGQ